MKKAAHEYDRKFDAGVYDKAYFVGDGSKSGYTDYANAEGIVRDQYAAIARIMKDRVGGDLKALDVACAYGFGVRQLRADGFIASGFDIAQWAVDQAIELDPELAGDVWQGDAMDPKAYGRDGQKWYDLVTSSEFFEHIESEHVDGVLNNMRHAAKWGFMLVNGSTRPDQPHDTDGDHGHLNHNSMEWWIDHVSQFGQIDFEAMFEFSKWAESYAPDVHWHNRVVVVKFN